MLSLNFLKVQTFREKQKIFKGMTKNQRDARNPFKICTRLRQTLSQMAMHFI